MTLIRLAALALAGLSLSACANFDPESFTKHMEARNCATEGRIDLHPVAMPGSKVTGHVAWNCGTPAAPAP